VRVHDVAATVDALKVWLAAETGRLDGWRAPTIADARVG